MASSQTVTLNFTTNPSGVIDLCRVVARHLTALADDLEHLGEPGDRLSRGEFAAVVEQAFRDAGPIYDSTGPMADVLAAAARLAR